MSTQITVRLPDEMVRLVDAMVASGQARSRASVVERALEHEMRRLLIERDVAILRGDPPEGDQTEGDLGALAAWVQRRPVDGGL